MVTRTRYRSYPFLQSVTSQSKHDGHNEMAIVRDIKTFRLAPPSILYEKDRNHLSLFQGSFTNTSRHYIGVLFHTVSSAWTSDLWLEDWHWLDNCMVDSGLLLWCVKNTHQELRSTSRLFFPHWSFFYVPTVPR